MNIDPNLLLNIILGMIPLLTLGAKIWHSVEMLEYKLKQLTLEIQRTEEECKRRDKRTDEALRQLTQWAANSSVNRPFSPRSKDYPSEDPPTGWL